MRVIAGELGGRTLHVPKEAGFRPTTDRVRESLFNILSNRIVWQECDVCDLFAGSGALGLEALSRGAKEAVFVEQSERSIAVLRKNVETLGVADRAVVVKQPVERFLERTDRRFTVIFADPPYAYDSYERILETIAERKLLIPSGLLSIEHGSRVTLNVQPVWHTVSERSYGTGVVTLLTNEVAQ